MRQQNTRFIIIFLCSISTARKRSLGQGNVFTPVCHSVNGGVVSAPLHAGIHPPWAATPRQIPTGYVQQAGGTHPTGMHTCLPFQSKFCLDLIHFKMVIKFVFFPHVENRGGT